MSTQTKRKSNLFSSLRQRTSFKDLHAQLKPSRSFNAAEKPLPLKPVDLNNFHYSKNNNNIIINKSVKPVQPVKTVVESIDQDPKEEVPLYLDEEQNFVKDVKRAVSTDTLAAPEDTSKTDVNSKRISTMPRSKPSPSSEKTLATLASQSDLGSLDTLFMDSPGDGFPEGEPLADNIKHLNYTGYIDLDLDEPSTPAKLRRTSNYGNINQFVSKDGMLPMSNRASLELEAKEIQHFKSKIAKTSDENFTVRLIENAFTMTFFQKELESDMKERFWDDLDYNDVLKADNELSSDPLVL